MSKVETRNQKLDFLRIVSMILIVLLHSIDHSGVLESVTRSNPLLYIYIYLIYFICQISVNCYVILSGYFLIRSKFRIEKLVEIWGITVFYSIAFKILIPAFLGKNVSIISLLSCFMPILTGRYWFITIYVGLYIVSPFINKLILSLNRQEALKLNFILFILFSLMISIWPDFKGMNSGAGWGLAWFIVLYIVGAYIRLYYQNKHNLGHLLLVILGIPLVMSVLVYLLPEHSIFQAFVLNQYRYDSALVYLLTITTFALFLNLKMKSKWINHRLCYLGPLTLAVYLIHAHADVSPFIWNALDLPSKMISVWFPIIQIVTVVMIFGICIFIELIRRVLFVKTGIENRIDILISLILKRIVAIMNEIYERALNKI